MKILQRFVWVASLSSLSVGSVAIADLRPPANRSPTIKQQVEEVTNRLVGVMDTSAQAAKNPKFVAVQMTTCRVGAIAESASASAPQTLPFLYQEQALLKRLQQPYRQRFLRILPGTDGNSVLSLSFKPNNPADWVGLCDRPDAQRFLPITKLGDPICSVRLVREEAVYLGNTPPGGCPTSYRGATYITNTIWLFKTGMDTSDRGFDADGNQVWGAEEAVYQFRRRD